ncbi:MAG: TRAP transporter TatT component family protein [Woeseiaceae bacterium]
MQRRLIRNAVLLLSLVAIAGCGGIVSSAASKFADDLGMAVLNQPDPEIVRDGAPSYLLLLDSLLEGSPDDPALLSAAADLYAAYGAVFARDANRAAILTNRALNYAERSVCLTYEVGCDWPSITFDEFEASLVDLEEEHLPYATSYAVASLAYIRAHSDDWAALARLPHIEALLLKLEPFSEGVALGAVYNYLGILNTLRPPALGGQPEVGKDYFEKAIALTEGKDLAIKVEYARGYARLLYEQELHDRLLNEVLNGDTEAPGLTLTNTLAKRDAETLLSSGADYF